VYGLSEPLIAVHFDQERVFLVDCDLDASILSIKLKLRDFVGLPVARLGLRPAREGEPWYKNEATLRQSGIRLQQVIFCFPIEPSGHKVNVDVDGRALEIPIENERQLVADLNWLISKETNLAVSDFELVIPSCRIDNFDVTFENAGISDETTLFVGPEMESETVTVTLALSERDLKLDLRRDETVESVQKIAETTEQVNEVRLFCNGWLLREGILISDLDLSEGAKIFVLTIN
jgi:hypothetical protein